MRQPWLLYAALMCAGCSLYVDDADHTFDAAAVADAGLPDAEVAILADAALPDAAPFACANDSELEPNEDLPGATVTPIPQFGTSYELVNLAVCPVSDVDVFRFDVEVVSDIRGRIDYAGGGRLGGELVNATGVSLRVGIPVPGETNAVEVTLANVPPGRYYVRVFAAAGGVNNYDLKLETPAAGAP